MSFRNLVNNEKEFDVTEYNRETMRIALELKKRIEELEKIILEEHKKQEEAD